MGILSYRRVEFPIWMHRSRLISDYDNEIKCIVYTPLQKRFVEMSPDTVFSTAYSLMFNSCSALKKIITATAKVYFPGSNSKNLVLKFGPCIDGLGRRSCKLLKV